MMLEVPLYVAVTVVLPAGKVEIVRLALPAFKLAVPNGPAAVVNVTVPTGTTVSEVIFAVNFTD